MCQLTGQEVANASMYDGSTATTEAVLMAERLTGRTRVLVARSLHPEYREVLRTYAKNSGLTVEEIAYSATGTLDVSGLKSALRDDVCAVVVQSPNFFGVDRKPGAFGGRHARSGRAAGGRHRGSAVLRIGEGSIGSGHCGDGGPEFWTGAELWRAVCRCGCIAGEICAADAGKIGRANRGPERAPRICADAGYTRTAYSREKATSNICTNQALCALAATVHLTLLGREGIREMAEQNLAKAQFALSQLEKIPSVKRSFAVPFFNEFAVELPRSVKMVNAELLQVEDRWTLCPGERLSGIEQARTGVRDGDDLPRGD